MTVESHDTHLQYLRDINKNINLYSPGTNCPVRLEGIEGLAERNLSQLEDLCLLVYCFARELFRKFLRRVNSLFERKEGRERETETEEKKERNVRSSLGGQKREYNHRDGYATHATRPPSIRRCVQQTRRANPSCGAPTTSGAIKFNYKLSKLSDESHPRRGSTTLVR